MIDLIASSTTIVIIDQIVHLGSYWDDFVSELSF